MYKIFLALLVSISFLIIPYYWNNPLIKTFTLRTKYGMKADASLSNIRYWLSMSILKTDCRYSRPFRRTEGFVSKNLNVNHLRIRSKLEIRAWLFSNKSSLSDSIAFIWYLKIDFILILFKIQPALSTFTWNRNGTYLPLMFCLHLPMSFDPLTNQQTLLAVGWNSTSILLTLIHQ